MRFLYKRQHVKNLRSDLEIVMDVMMSDLFIMLDLFLYSVIFTILMFPVFPSLTTAVLFFCSSYVFFNSLYFLFFKKRKKKRLDS